VKIVGVTGPTAIAVRVGFTKKPRQLTARAKAANAAKAPITRRLDFFEDIVLYRSLGALSYVCPAWL